MTQEDVPQLALLITVCIQRNRMQERKVMVNLEDWFRMLEQPASNNGKLWAGKGTVFPCLRTHVKNDGYRTSDAVARETGLRRKSRTWNSRLKEKHISLGIAVLDVRFEEKIVLALVNLSSVFHDTQFGNHWRRALKWKSVLCVRFYATVSHKLVTVLLVSEKTRGIPHIMFLDNHRIVFILKPSCV